MEIFKQPKYSLFLLGSLDLNGFTVRRYPHPRFSPYRVDEINENFVRTHPEIQHDIRGFVVIQLGQLQVLNNTSLVRILRYLNENVATDLILRPINENDVTQQFMHNVEMRARVCYHNVQQFWDYDRLCFWNNIVMIHNLFLLIVLANSVNVCF